MSVELTELRALFGVTVLLRAGLSMRGGAVRFWLMESDDPPFEAPAIGSTIVTAMRWVHEPESVSLSDEVDLHVSAEADAKAQSPQIVENPDGSFAAVSAVDTGADMRLIRDLAGFGLKGEGEMTKLTDGYAQEIDAICGSAASVPVVRVRVLGYGIEVRQKPRRRSLWPWTQLTDGFIAPPREVESSSVYQWTGGLTSFLRCEAMEIVSRGCTPDQIPHSREWRFYSM